MKITRKAMRTWKAVSREMPLRLDNIAADLAAGESAYERCLDLVGRDVVGTSERDKRRTAEALLAHGIAGQGSVTSKRDRAHWLVPAHSSYIWAAVVERIRTENLRQPLTDLLGAQVRPGWVRPIVKVDHASTGRTHVEAPRLQGLSKRLVARYIDVPTLIVDQSRAEPTVLAHLSQDAVLAADLRGDPYAALASDLGIDRATAKRIFMSVPYGSGAARITRELGIDEDAAQAVIDGWRTRYADAAAWCDDRVAEARSGVVRLYDGTELRPGAPYLGPSHVGQGTGALLTHEWTVAAHEALPAGASLAWPVHDALVVEVADESVRDEAGRVLCDLLDDLTIPLRGEIEMETNDDD